MDTDEGSRKWLDLISWFIVVKKKNMGFIYFLFFWLFRS